MKFIKKIKGSLLSIAFFIITVPTVIFNPVIQISAIGNSSIYRFVRNYLVDQSSSSHCETELVLTCSIYFSILIIASTIFFILCKKLKWSYLVLIPLLSILFYFLQNPFFIMEVGTLYNCKSDGQTIMAAMASSPKLSLFLIIYGIIYDSINYKKSS